jgi:hypothetical protein
MKAKPARLEYFEFTDHGSACGWLERSDIVTHPTANKMRAAGFVIKETPHTICLANFCDVDDASHSRMYIVKAAITLRRRLRVPR